VKVCEEYGVLPRWDDCHGLAVPVPPEFSACSCYFSKRASRHRSCTITFTPHFHIILPKSPSLCLLAARCFRRLTYRFDVIGWPCKDSDLLAEMQTPFRVQSRNLQCDSLFPLLRPSSFKLYADSALPKPGCVDSPSRLTTNTWFSLSRRISPFFSTLCLGSGFSLANSRAGFSISLHCT